MCDVPLDWFQFCFRSEICLDQFLVLQIRFSFLCSYLPRLGFSVPYFQPGCPKREWILFLRWTVFRAMCSWIQLPCGSSTRSISVPAGVGPKAPFFTRSIQPMASPAPFTGAWFSRCPESRAADFQCVLPCPAGTHVGAWSQFDLVTVWASVLVFDSPLKQVHAPVPFLISWGHCAFLLSACISMRQECFHR
jgi:hypothetical protein